jgi:hypothetical protein
MLRKLNALLQKECTVLTPSPPASAQELSPLKTCSSLRMGLSGQIPCDPAISQAAMMARQS